jgi:hypothetical protein
VTGSGAAGPAVVEAAEAPDHGGAPRLVAESPQAAYGLVTTAPAAAPAIV